MLTAPLPPANIFTIIPNTGLQFLDFGFDAKEVAAHRRNFVETRADGELNLLIVSPQAGGNGFVSHTGETVSEDDVFAVRFEHALAVLAEDWIPMPFFKELGRDASGRWRFDQGPSNWVRARIMELDELDENGHTHRVVLCVDTDLVRAEDVPADLVKPGPQYEAVKDEPSFGFAFDIAANSWLLSQDWMFEWLRDSMGRPERQRLVRVPRGDDGNVRPTMPWTYYVTLLSGLAEAGIAPRLKLLNTIESSSARQAVDVDLVLDVGNSRTCGVLIENPEREGLNLGEARTLELRDLTRPCHIYNEPFRSHAEFHRIDFGNARLARGSGRAGFEWASPIRVGPEAVRLDGMRFGAEGPSGVSGPKRYLWDDQPSRQPWVFNSATTGDSAVPVFGAFTSFVNANGDLKGADDGETIDPLFSRSSIFTLLLVEILYHAFAQINSVSYRRQSPSEALPRRLRRLILSIPTGTPLIERQIFEGRAQEARALFLELSNRKTDPDDQRHELKLEVKLDEATCTQMVYLYNEIAQRFGRDPKAVLETLSRNEPGSLRIASLDIGGGTTDLMIMTYRAEGGALRPQEDFREGFRRAGDDLLRAVIAHVVLPALARHAHACGLAEADDFVAGFMQPRDSTAVVRHRRKLFTSQVLVPIGLAVLSAHEELGRRGDYLGLRQAVQTIDVASAIDGAPVEPRRHFEAVAADAGATGLDLRDLQIQITGEQIESVFGSEIEPMLRALCRVIGELKCDILLVSGRPSRLPAIMELLMRQVPISPHRLIPMHRYRVGSWYPFATPQGFVGDPKTTVVVGALISTLGNDMLLTDFAIDMRNFSLGSTARIFGTINGEVIEPDSILFDDTVDPEEIESRPAPWNSMCYIGFRQLKYERWPATPLYCVSITPSATERHKRMSPWMVVYRRPDLPEPNESGARKPRTEQIGVLEIQGSTGDATTIPRAALDCQLKTMTEPDGYWLDTGLVQFMEGMKEHG